jgi:hypothetical protein
MLYGKSQVKHKMSNGKDNLEVELKAFTGLLGEFRSGNVCC